MTELAVGITTVLDGIYEGDETLEFVISMLSGPAVTGSVDRVTITITDADTAPVAGPPAVEDVTVTLRLSSVTVSEGSSETLYIVLTEATSEDVTVTLTVAGTATDGADYELLPSAPYVLTVGMTELAVGIKTVLDGIYEGDETLEFVISMLSGPAVTGSVDRVTITITDADTAPVAGPPAVEDVTVTLRLSSVTVSEGSSETLYIVLTEATSEDVTVTLTVAGTATDGADYELLPSAPYVLTPGTTELAVGITTVLDGIYEGDETLEFVISMLSGPAVTGSVDRVTITITDADTAPVAGPPAVEDVTVTLRLSSVTVSEGGSETLYIVLTEAASEDVTVTLTVAGTATDGADYELLPSAPYVLTVGMTELAVGITTVLDGIYEGDETLEFVISTLSGPAVTGSVDRVTITITDADTAPVAGLPAVEDVTVTLRLSSVTVSEGSSETLYIVLTEATSEDVTVTLTVAGTATDGADYELLPSAPYVLTPGTTELAVGISTVLDGIYEGDETLEFVISTLSGPAVAGSVDRVTVTIVDIDQPGTPAVDLTATLSVDSITLLEGTTKEFKILLTANAPEDLTFTLVGDSAYTGDYTLSPVEIVIGTDKREVTVSLTANNDNAVEGDESFVLELKSASARVMIGTPGTLMVTIEDGNQAPPEATHIEFVVLTATIDEGDVYEIELRLLGTVNGIVKPLQHSDDVVVTLEVYGHGTDSLAGEFMFSSTVTIPAGQITGSAGFISVEDTDVESDERVTLLISAVTMVSSSSLPGRDNRDMFTITVRDDDAEIGFSDTTYSIPESDGGVTITIDVDGRLAEDVTLGVEYVPGTASETEDYAPLTRNVPLLAGATRATLFVQIVNDELYENADMFSVRLVEPNGGLPFGVELVTAMTVADVTIINDDEIEIGFVEGMYTFLENQRQGTAQVRYSGSDIAPGVDVLVHYSTTVEIGDSIDINDVSGTLVLSSAKRVYNINFPITDDNAFNRATERYTVSLGTFDMNSGLTFRLDRVSASLNVLTDDVLDFGFSVTEYEVNEASGTVELEVSVLRNTIGAGERVVVIYSTTSGSATSSNPSDFESVTGMVILSSTATVVTFAIPIVNDDRLENSESFVVTLRKADGRDTLQLLQSEAKVTILDDNDPVTIGFGSASYSVTEGAGAVVDLDVGVLSGGLERDITATYEIRAGSAVAGEDYVDVIDGTVTLSSNASKTISITLLGDDIFDPDEIFTVVLTGHHGPGSVMLAPDSAIVTIVDAGPVPTISLDPVADVTEGNSQDVIARLSGKLNRDVTVRLTANDVSTENGDYSFNPTITIPAGSLLATFTVVAAADPVYEGAESVTLIVASDEVGPGTPIMRTLTINDNSRVKIGFQETTYRVIEGEGAKEAVVRVAVLTGQIAPGVNIDVRYSTSFDSAMPGSDYTADADMLRFNSKDTEHTIMIPITDDKIYEDAEERFTIDLTLVSSLARVSAAPAVSEILITDDDKPTLTIKIEGDIKVLEEGDSTVVTVRLSNQAANPITILLTTLATTTSATIGTVESDDYTISPADRVIPVGATSITFALTALVNVQRERDEILALQASATGLESVSRELTIPGAVDAIIEPTRPPRTFQACENADSGVQACVEVPKETISMSTVTLEIDKVDQYQKNNIIAPAELPTATALLDEVLIWDIRFMDDNDIVIETLSNTVQIELTASKAIVDEYGGPGVVSIATLHSGSTEWVALPTSYTSTVEMTPTGKEKYRFTAFSKNFSLFTLIVPVTATLSASAASVQEGQSIDLVITLSAPAGEDIVFNLSKVGGDAVEGVNYRLPASITIVAGERSVRVPLTTIYDFNSRSEVLEIELSVRGTAAVVGLMNRATITIVDDPPPVATLDVDEIQEGDSTVVTYELSHARARVPITVSLRDVAGTSDIRITPASITLAPGETTAEFNLMAICDILPEGVETLTLEAISTELGSVRTMLDVRDIMLDIESVTELDEDDSAIVRVRLSSAGCNPTTVSLTAIGGTADLDDYTLSPASFTIDGADTIAEFRLTAHDDSQVERDETLVLEASVVGLESVMTTITIIDLVEDEGTGLPPTGGLAFPLWLVAVLLLTGLTLVVGTVYVVRRRPSAPRI